MLTELAKFTNLLVHMLKMTKLVDKNSCYINEQEFFSTSFVIFNICANKLVNFANSVSNLCYIFKNYNKIYQLVDNFGPNVITKRQKLLEEGENVSNS